MHRRAVLVACTLAVAGCSYDGSRLRAPVPSDAAPEALQAPADVPPSPDLLAPRPDTAKALADVASDLAADPPPEDAAVAPDATSPPDLAANDDTADGPQIGATGGVVGTGGTVAAGGAGGTGGGGSVGTGGDGGSGGTSADATPDVLPDVSPDVSPDASPDGSPGTVVTFVDGKAQGAFWGSTFASLGLRDTLTSPTCNGFAIPGQAPAGDPALALASECPPEETIWSSSVGLCMSGSIPAWPPNPTDADYDNNWGLLVGVNTREPRQGMGVSYRSIKLTASGTPTTGLRALVHLNQDPLNITYCAKVTLGSPINFTSFNTHCWDNSGVALLASDAVKIDMVALLVASSEYEITVRNLCLTRIDLTK